ncbi:MAG TPA: penicillin-binding protein 2 [Candidatus Saccharimonadales bacterium]|jgi:cell division protein FtsI/penicillin-binding protein 2
MTPTFKRQQLLSAAQRITIWYVVLVLVFAIFGLRAFYVQVIRYDYYHQRALSDQLKQAAIPATRGIIEAHDGNSIVPIVLNQKLYTIYGDPTLIKNPKQVAQTVANVLGGKASSYQSKLQTQGTQYVVLANKVSQAHEQKLLAYKYPGLGAQEQDYRTYPQGSLAAQLLGFVNNSGQGEYGVEQALNGELAGTPGELKAITDANGVPLAATGDNVDIAPQAGNNVVLSVNIGMQQQVQQILAREYQKTNSQGLSAIVMDPNTGQVKAMANYPSYNPANYQNVSNPSLFENAAVSNAIEPGSSMKTLTTSAALNSGAITPDESFYDPAHWLVDNFNITDIEQDGGPREQNIQSILALSLNTGATWMLMQMSQPGGTQINQKGINTWHDYMTKHFRLGEDTGIEQGYESPGYVPSDNPSQPALALTYANTAFGQGVQVTALQMGAALSSVLNGGTYYQPTLVSQTIDPNTGKTTTNQPKVLEKNVVAPKVGQELIPLMEGVVTQYLHEGFGFMNFPSDYLVGGKTGTAQVAQPGGGYYSSIFNGTYVGFVGGNKPQYVIVVFNIKPNVPGYAGSLGGQPVFADIAHMLINDGDVTPKN